MIMMRLWWDVQPPGLIELFGTLDELVENWEKKKKNVVALHLILARGCGPSNSKIISRGETWEYENSLQVAFSPVQKSLQLSNSPSDSNVFLRAPLTRPHHYVCLLSVNGIEMILRDASEWMIKIIIILFDSLIILKFLISHNLIYKN